MPLSGITERTKQTDKNTHTQIYLHSAWLKTGIDCTNRQGTNIVVADVRESLAWNTVIWKKKKKVIDSAQS